MVQGVGFRPHVYRLARDLHVAGTVANTATGVIVDAQAPAAVLDDLARRIRDDAPALADVRSLTATDLPEDPELAGFTILTSDSDDGRRTTVPPDTAVCDDCLRELADPADRRYRHPFITCTNCGPRFTIVTGLPYDRPLTSMAGFPMCPDCDREYHDPADRRFHAQPVACPACGPHLWAVGPAALADVAAPAGATAPVTRTTGDEAALARAQQVLAAGGTVAVKGLGGYHLACRPDAATVGRLRARKHRPDKPFALMARDLPAAARLVHLDAPTTDLLTGPARPIVLAPRRADAPVTDLVAPGAPDLGVMLAYTPLHHLLLTPGPDGAPACDVLVMTSANLTDEPLCYRDDVDLLLGLADLVLGHDRPIVTPCDDSVLRVVDGRPYPVRRSRGHTPLPVHLDLGEGRELPATFAVGAELKNTVCVLDGTQAVCSQHLGDMAGWESQQTLAATAAHVLALYQVTPTRWAADAHPAYQTRAWAQRFADVPLVEVQHHRAHAAALLAEHHLLGTEALVACFDGTGYGDDGTAWGGEWLTSAADLPDRGQSALTRVASLAPVDMIGGDRAVREPWRLALAHLRRAGVPWTDDLPPVADTPEPDRRLLATALDRRLAATPTTSVGRLFDAVSALLGVRQVITYEGQAAIELEHLALAALPEPDPAGRATAGAGAGPDRDAPDAAGMRHGVETSGPDPRRLTGARAALTTDPATWSGDPTVAGAAGWAAVGTSALPAGDPRRAVLDPTPVLAALVAGLRAGTDRAALALGFHQWLAAATTDLARAERHRTGVGTVGLTGGVFANTLLLRATTARLEANGFRVVRHHLVPCNDGGLSLGQAVLAAAGSTKEHQPCASASPAGSNASGTTAAP